MGNRAKNQGIYVLGVCAVTAFFLCAGPAWAAPDSDLWDRWLIHDENSTTTVDHDAWNTLLQKFVVFGDDGINRVAYGWIIGGDKMMLDEYLDDLSRVSVSSLSRDEQRAYWINMYNALTINVVLDAGKITSIRDIDISPGFFSNGPWGKKLITVEGESLSLDDIEHRILRPIWQDPRIHYALNCAALSCPNLWGVAVTVENIETYLNHGAKAFINHPRGSRVEGGRVVASSIYKWFAEDFGGTDAAIIDHIKGYASDDLVAALDGVTDVEFESYDWTLNSNVLPNLVAVGTRRGS